jgi:hypothetical protein
VFVKIPNVPCVQAIRMTRHCKLYSGKIIEFQNFTIAPINQWMNESKEWLVSECCTVFFCLSVLLHLFCIINILHVGVDYLIIYLLCRILGGGWNFFGGVDILFGGVIANIGGGGEHPQKIRLCPKSLQTFWKCSKMFSFIKTITFDLWTEYNVLFSRQDRSTWIMFRRFMKVTCFLRTDLCMTRKESLSFRHEKP